MPKSQLRGILVLPRQKTYTSVVVVLLDTRIQPKPDCLRALLIPPMLNQHMSPPKSQPQENLSSTGCGGCSGNLVLRGCAIA